MKKHCKPIIFFLLLIAWIGNMNAQTSCSAGSSLIYLYTGYGKSYTINNASYVTAPESSMGIPDGTVATVKHNATPANLGVLTIDLTDNVPQNDTIYFTASAQDTKGTATWDVTVSSDGTNFSAVTGYSSSTNALATTAYIVNNASGARYIRFASTSTSKDLKLDGVYYHKKTCKSYCFSTAISYSFGNATANPTVPAKSTAETPANALGAANNTVSKINGSGTAQILYLDLGVVVPYGTYIQLLMADEVAGSHAILQVSGSKNDTTWTSTQSFTTTQVQPNFTDFYYQVTQGDGIRYLKITNSVAVKGDIDAVTFQYPTYWGKDWINGYVFSDANVNTIKDGIESGTTGITVNLSKDINNNGAFDPGDVTVQTTTTTAGGYYSFQVSSLDTNYLISVTPSTLPATTSLTSLNVQRANFTTFNNTDCDNNFGYYTCTGNCKPVANDDYGTAVLGTASYVNVLFNDYDANGNLNNLSVEVIVQPKKGSVVVNQGVLIYTPIGTGYDTLTYRVADLTSPTPLWDTAIVVISTTTIIYDACTDASLSHVYYIPAPEQDLRAAFQRADCKTGGAISDSMRTIISIKCPYPGIVIYYDHWEDGYESALLNPSQTTTMVWGDGDLYNGIAPGYADDIIPAGGNIVLDNMVFDNPRNSATQLYDAKDKLFSNAAIALSRISWDKSRGTLQAYSVDVYDLSRFGTSFTVPVGNYTGCTKDFQYTGAFIRAAYDNTVISIDKNNDGVVDTTTTLTEGQSFFQNGGVMAGASITSSLPVGVDVFFGDSSYCFNFKELNILPASFYGDIYYSPVPTTKSPDSAVAMFYNPLSTTITINWTTSASSGSFPIAAHGVYRLQLGPNGYKFQSAGGEYYVVNELIDAWSVDGVTSNGGDYDWAFALIPESRLTSFGSIAWAPGSSTGASNGNPVWVMPTAATTIYVKWDGNVTGTTGSTSPCGLKYDSTWVMTSLQVRKLLDVDNDQSGLAVYNCGGIKMAMAYGEDPIINSIGAPYIDVGTSIQPFCIDKNMMANDDFAFTLTGTPVTINVMSNDTGFLATLDRTSVSTTGFRQPSNGTVSVNSNGTLLYRPVAGFTGYDTLVYQVCSTAPAVCDVATVIIKVSACPSPSKKNLIQGQVFNDISKDGLNNDGGSAIYPAKVYLYVDGNCNSTIDANEISDSATVDAGGSYQFLPYAQRIIKDDFDSAGTRSHSNGTDGNTPWLSDWSDVGSSDPSTGFNNGAQTVANTDVEFIKDALGVGLRLKDKNRYAQRTVNISGATAASLSFSYRRKSATFISTDTVKVQMSTNGTAWTNLYLINGNAAVDAAYVNVNNLDILSYASATTYIRFATGNSHTDADSVYIDNVTIKYLKYNQCYIVRLDTTSSVPAGSYVTTAKQYAFTVTSAAQCATPYDFGITKTSMTVSGTLYNDANGLSDGLVNGTAIDAPSGVTMYVYLVDSTGNIAFKDTLNNGNGTFMFDRANTSTLYSVIVSSVSLSVGADISQATLPSKWSSVGENYGSNNNAGSGNEAGTPNSVISVRTGVTAVTLIKIGIQLPDAGPDRSTCEYYGINTVTMAAATTTGTWTAQSDNPGTATITSPTTTNTTITNFSDGGTYHFIWTNAVGARDTAAVVITEPYAGADSAVCGASIGTLTGNYTTGTWTARAGNPAGGTLGSTVNGIATVNYTPASTGSYYYVYTVNTCPDTVKLAVTPKPTATAATSTLYDCANASGFVGSLTTTNPSPNSGIWSIGSGPGSIATPLAFNSTIGSLSKTGVPTVAWWVVTDSYSCHDTSITTLSPPTVDTSLVSKYSTSFCITCPIINGNNFSYYDINGKLLASVTDSNDATAIGQTDFCAKLNYPVAGDPAVSNVQSMDTWLLGVGHLPQPYLPRSWTLNTTNDAPMTVKLYFTDAEIAALQGATLNNGNYYYFATAPELNIAAYPNNSDTFIPAGSPNGLVIHPTFTRVGGYWEAAFRMAQSSTFYLYPPYYENAPLPVELISFEATPLETIIRLDWSTASEINNMRFDIERSTDGINFEKIGQIAGAGNYRGTQNYTFNDEHVTPGVLYYYRLKQIDISGHSTDSRIKQAMINSDAKMVISQFIPNPADVNTMVRITSNEDLEMNVKIFSIDGRFVSENKYQVIQGQSEISFDVSMLAKGSYVVQFNSTHGTEVRKLIRLE